MRIACPPSATLQEMCNPRGGAWKVAYVHTHHSRLTEALVTPYRRSALKWLTECANTYKKLPPKTDIDRLTLLHGCCTAKRLMENELKRVHVRCVRSMFSKSAQRCCLETSLFPSCMSAHPPSTVWLEAIGLRGWVAWRKSNNLRVNVASRTLWPDAGWSNCCIGCMNHLNDLELMTLSWTRGELIRLHSRL